MSSENSQNRKTMIRMARRPKFDEDQIRLETLIRLRWMAVAGQLSSVCFVAFILKFPMPVFGALGLIALSALLNIILALRFSKVTRVRSAHAGILLGYDILQLSSLLFLTGGIENPFAMLLLAPVTISATSLNRRWTIILGALALAAIAVLFWFHLPLPQPTSGFLAGRALYLVGMAPALACTLLFISTYARRIAQESRQLANALNATEMVLAREQHLSALDSLAAAAAHELGTPLATIALVANEMSDNPNVSSAIAEDIALIKEQSDRCRTILSRLSHMQNDGGHPFDAITLDQLLEECAAPHRDYDIDVRIHYASVKAESPLIERNAGLAYGLGNLIENATDFAKSQVQINVSWDTRQIELEIIDDGPGFAPDILDKLGDPYTTTRPRRSAHHDPVEPSGLGLGIFIAKILLERTGAVVTFSNAREEGNARVTIVWPASALAEAITRKKTS